MTVSQAVKVMTKVLRVPLLLAGLWILFRQALQPFVPVSLPINVIDGFCITLSLAFLLWFFLHCKPMPRGPITIGIAILLAGLFVLQLAPHDQHSERVTWASSIRLFGSRMLPLLGLLTAVLAWHRRLDPTVIVTPFRQWMKLSRPLYTTIAAMLAFLFSWLMAEFGYGGMPVVDDGVAHLFQAKIFATGRLALPSPPHAEAFRFFGIIQEPRWVAMFPAGFPAILSVAVLFGGISLVNPLLTALSVPAVELIAYRSAGKKAAAVTVLLFAFSPFVPVMGGSFRSHPLSLLLLAWSTGLLLDPLQRRESILLSGGAAGFAFLARPYTAFLWCTGLVLGIVACRRNRLRRIVMLFGLGALPGLSLAVLYNLVQTGGAVIPAPIFLYGERFGLGFGPRAMGSHTILRAISYTSTRIEALGRMVMGWPFPLLLLPFSAMAFPGQPLRSRNVRWILLLPVVAVVLGYGFYWCLEFTHGPRFVYCILATMLPLCAESLLVLPVRLSALLQSVQRDAVVRALSLGLILSIIFAGAITWPRTFEVFGGYHSARPDIADRVNDLPTSRTLILFSPRSEIDSGFGAGLLLNNLSLSGDLVVALDLGQEKNREVIDLFPGRTVYRYQFDPILRRGSMERYKTEESQPSVLSRNPAS